MNNYLVYEHVSPSGKSYIGITKNYYQRTMIHKAPSNSHTPFGAAIKKYGWENFSHQILKDGLTIDSAIFWETFYIERKNTLHPHGYNRKANDSRGKFSDESTAKISRANMGRKQSPEVGLKISHALKGKKHNKIQIEYLYPIDLINKKC